MRKLHMPYLQISEAARYIYAAEGPKGLTMRKPARSLGISASALYRHFENKDAIVDAVSSVADQQLGRIIWPAGRRPPRGNRLHAMSRRMCRFATQHPHLFQLVSRRGPHHDGAGTRAFAMRAELSAAAHAGHAPKCDPSRAASMLWSHYCGLAAMRERGELATDAELRRAWEAGTWRLEPALA